LQQAAEPFDFHLLNGRTPIERLLLIPWKPDSDCALLAEWIDFDNDAPKAGELSLLLPLLTRHWRDRLYPAVRADARAITVAHCDRLSTLSTARPPICPLCLAPCWFERVEEERGFIRADCRWCNYRTPHQRYFRSDRFACNGATIPVRPRPEKMPCYVCGVEAPTQRHHLAPYEVFGAEAGRWPTVQVCKECHSRWHLLMNQARQKRGAA
jgi:hypothetical protein